MHPRTLRQRAIAYPLTALLLGAVLAGCASDTSANNNPTTSGSDANRDASSAQSPGIAGAIVDVASREAAGVQLKPLDTPLPGNVLPDFVYGVMIDMTRPVNQTVTIRQVSMRIREIDAESARDVLVRQYLAAGFDTSAVMRERETHAANFSNGGEGKGLMAAMSGGTSVMVLATPSKPDSENLADGFSGVLMVTVYSPAK